MDIKKIKYGQLVGIGESTHGTSEYQIQRLKIIKYLRQQGPIQVFLEASYPVIETLKAPNLAPDEFKNRLVESKIFGFYKSKEFYELLWYLYSNKIPFYGIDIQIRGQERLIKNPIMDHINKFYKEAYTNSALRDEKMQELVDILWDRSTRGIVLAHNYHISKYVNFPGMSIGFATSGGTVVAFDKKSAKFKTVDIDYPDQKLKFSKNCIIVGKQNTNFNNLGFFTDSRGEMCAGKFDYIIYIKRTSGVSLIKKN